MVKVDELLEAVTAATAADLAAVAEEVRQLEKRLAALKVVEAAMAAAVNGPAPRQKKGPPWKPDAPPATLTARRQLAFRYLRESGPVGLDDLAAATGINRYGPGAISLVVAHEWFFVGPDGLVSVTDKGLSDPATKGA